MNIFFLCILTTTLITICVPNQFVNNAAWLEAEWENNGLCYTSKPQNSTYTTWSINENAKRIIEKAQISINSSKRYVILTNDTNTIEYHILKLENEQLELKIIKSKQLQKSIILTHIQKKKFKSIGSFYNDYV